MVALDKNFFLIIGFTVTWHQMARAGVLSPDSQIETSRTGCVTMDSGGMTNRLPWEQQLIHPLILT